MHMHEAIDAYLAKHWATATHDKVRQDCIDVMTGNRAPNQFEASHMIPEIKRFAAK